MEKTRERERSWMGQTNEHLFEKQQQQQINKEKGKNLCLHQSKPVKRRPFKAAPRSRSIATMGISGPNNHKEKSLLYIKRMVSHMFSLVGFALCKIKFHTCVDIPYRCVSCTTHFTVNISMCAGSITHYVSHSLILHLFMPSDWSVLILMVLLLLLLLRLLLMNYYCVSNRWTGRHIPFYTEMCMAMVFVCMKRTGTLKPYPFAFSLSFSWNVIHVLCACVWASMAWINSHPHSLTHTVHDGCE